MTIGEFARCCWTEAEIGLGETFTLSEHHIQMALYPRREPIQ